jgi:hypothetical protein
VSAVAGAGRREDAVLLSPEIDGMLLHMRGLVLARGLLAERGASPEELDAHTRELERLRARLAELVGPAAQAGAGGTAGVVGTAGAGAVRGTNSAISTAGSHQQMYG